MNGPDSYYLQHPKEQRFYKVLGFIMYSLALNTQYWEWFDAPKHLFFRIHRLAMLIAAQTPAMSQIMYLILNQNEHEFQALSLMYSILSVTVVVWIRVNIAQTTAYKSAMKDFMTKIHLHNYVTRGTYYEKKVLISTEKLTRWSNAYLMFFCYACLTGFEFVPIAHNYQKVQSIHNITERLEIVVHFWLPFDFEYNFNNWLIVQVSCIYCGIVTITILALFDSVNLAFIYHIIGHIKIFKYRIRTSFYDGITQEEISENIKELCSYYCFITQTLSDVESAFGFNVASIYLHNLFGGGLFIYQISMSGTETGTLLTYGLMIPLYMGTLIIISFALENIRILADDIPDLIYGLNFENMSLSNQKMILMMLGQSQKPLEFTAAFNIRTGMQPAINIIKTAFSYYVMIKSRVQN